MASVQHRRVLGVDACKAGWVGVAPDHGDLRAYVASEIADLVAEAERDGPVGVVAIDIPLGMPDGGRRQADILARQRIGPRWPAVFMTPVRDALLAPDHATAVRISRRRAGEGLSIQAYRIGRKLLAANDWVAAADRTVVEVHPEVSFAHLAGEPLASRKATWAGAEERRRLLATAGLHPGGDLGLAGLDVGVDDVLDATVAAWTALRVLTGDAMSLPDPPERFADGLPAAIWV